MWCARMHPGPVHATLPVTVYNADGVRITTSAEQQPTGALPVIVVIMMSANGVTTLHMPLYQAQALQVGLYSLMMKVEGIGPRRPVMSTRETAVRTLTVREGRKVVEKRVVLVAKANPNEPILSLSAAEAQILGRRLGMEGRLIEGGGQ